MPYLFEEKAKKVNIFKENIKKIYYVQMMCENGFLKLLYGGIGHIMCILYSNI